MVSSGKSAHSTDKGRGKAASETPATPAGLCAEQDSDGSVAQLLALRSRLGNSGMHALLRGIRADHSAKSGLEGKPERSGLCVPPTSAPAVPDRDPAQLPDNQGMQRMLRYAAHALESDASASKAPVRPKSALPAATRAGAPIQAKLGVGASNDPLEHEADRVADQAMEGFASVPVSGSASRVQRAAGAAGCEAKAAPASVDRVLASPGRPLEPGVQEDMERRFGHDFSQVRVHSDPAAAQSARDVNARAFTVGADIAFAFGEYRPDTREGRRLLAHELAHVVRGAGSSDRVLLRKEGEGEETAAAPTYLEMLANPPLATYSVTASGMTLRVPGIELAKGDTGMQLMAIVLRALVGGQYTPKLVPLFMDVLSRAKAQKTGAWLGAAAQAVTTPPHERTAEEKPAAKSEEASDIFLDAEIAITILYGLKAKLGLTPTTTPEQEDVLLTGVVATKAWAEIIELHLGPGEVLPPWYNKYIFDRQAATHVNDITLYGEGLDLLAGTKRGKDVRADEWRDAALNVIVDMLNEEASVLDAIRRDTSLCEVPPGLEGEMLREVTAAANAYRALWEVPKDAVPTSPPTVAKDTWLITAFLGWSHSQPTLGKRAEDDADHRARVELLARFGRYIFGAQATTAGDEILRASPEVANAPPFPSTLSAYPRLEAPLFQSPLESERRFEMQLQFQTVFEAFSYYHFHWQLLPIRYTPPLDDSQLMSVQPKESAKPEENVSRLPNASPAAGAAATSPAAAASTPAATELQKPPSEFDEATVAMQIDATMSDMGALGKLKGEAPSTMDRLRLRYARAVQYHKEDIKTVFRDLGPAGIGAMDLVSLNAIMRYAGTGLSVLIDEIFSKKTGTSSDKNIAFPNPGIYIVRCIGLPFVAAEEELVRAPSVAYQPVFVRPAEEITAAAVYAARQRADDERSVKTDLDKLLTADLNEKDPSKKLAPAERAMLVGLQEDVVAADQGVHATLALKLKRIEETIKAHESDKVGNAGLLADDYEQRDRLKELLKMQKGRELKSALPLRATFVSDGGETIPLDMEADVRQDKGGTWTAKVSDLTSIRSGTESGSGGTRSEAIQTGVRKVLESMHGYGRGIVALEMEGKIETVRIAADVGQIEMEGIENVTTILTIAAIAAAPFTDGATLTLLIPIGAVGAIPSVYRLVDRHRVGTLRWDLETAMDLVNIVAAVASLGELGLATRTAGLTAKGLRPGVWAIRAGRGLLIINHAANLSGVVLLGGGILMQLEALKGLPEGEANARRRQIIGGALLQAGIMVGGSLAAEHVAAQNERLLAARGLVEKRPNVGDERVRPLGERTKAELTKPKPDTQSTLAPREKPIVTGDKQAKGAAHGVDPAMAEPVKLTERPTETAAAATKDKVPSELDPSEASRTMAGTKEGGSPKPATDPTIAPDAKAKADQLEAALASGEKMPEVKLDALHPDRTSASIPERFTWEQGIEEWPHAMARYKEARAAAPGREVGVWRNAKDGTYAVTVGNGHEVHPPAGPDWEGVLHFHPNVESTTRFQLPAPADFAQLMQRYHASEGKTSVREFVDSGMPGGREARVEYGINAGEEFPFYVTHDMNGEKITARFRDDGTYRQEWNSQAVYVDEGTARQMKMELDAWLQDVRGKRAELEPASKADPDTGVKTPTETSRTMTGTEPKRPPRRIIVRPQEKAPTATAAPAKRAPLTDEGGQLTAAGREYLRENVKGYRHKSDMEIDADFSQHGTPHEAVNRAEAIAAREGMPLDDPNAYLITKGYRGRKAEPTLSGIFTEIRDVAGMAGRTLGGDPTLVNRSIDQLVGLIGDNAHGPHVIPNLQAEAQRLLNHPDPRVRAEFERFYFGEVQHWELLTELANARREVPAWLRTSEKGWAQTRVGNTRPDMTELMLGNNEIQFTDFTHRYSDPVHNFKMMFYREVTSRATGLTTVGGTEYRGPRQQTPLP